MPPQKDTRQYVKKIDDVLRDLITPPNDYLPEALTAVVGSDIHRSGTLNQRISKCSQILSANEIQANETYMFYL